MQNPDETLENIRMKHLKTLKTYAYNIKIKNDCNIRLEADEIF